MARYSGRTLDAYRHDRRNLLQWAADHGLPVLEATRAHLEMYRSSMEDRGLAASSVRSVLPSRWWCARRESGPQDVYFDPGGPFTRSDNRLSRRLIVVRRG